METSQQIDRAVLRDLSRRSLFPWLLDITLDWAIISATFMTVALLHKVFIIPLALLILGNRQHALALLAHDATHQTLSEKRQHNDFLNNLLGFWPIGLTTSGYRILHFEHHRHTGDENDPELAHKRSRSPQWDLPAGPWRVVKYAALDMIGGSLADYKVIITYSKPADRKEYIPLLLWHVAFVVVLSAIGLWWAAALWYGALTTTFMLFFRLRLWLEHQGTPETHRLHLNPIASAILAPHNAWLHWEHHNFPSVPYHRLKLIRKLTPGVPILSLRDLVALYGRTAKIASGRSLKQAVPS